MSVQSTKSKRNDAKLKSSKSSEPTIEAQNHGGVKLKKSATKLSNQKVNLVSTPKSQLKSRKRTLDVTDGNDSKSVTKKSLSDKPSEAKKVKPSESSSRKAPKSHAYKNPQTSKSNNESSQPEHSAGAMYQKSEDKDSKTAMLLRGFESSDDEDSSGQNLDLQPTKQQEDIPAIPELRQTTADTESRVSTKHEDGGVVYVGRIPHGFYEHQMNAYFSQFGEIRRLRISRNRKTGHVKHYAFIEFGSSEVAKIVAATMDKYLLFGHILQVRVIPSDQVHPDLFKGAGKKFRVIPRNKIEAETLKAGLSREGWQKRIKMENSRRKKKNMWVKKTMDYSYEAPAIMNVTKIPLRVNEGKRKSDVGDDSITGKVTSSAKIRDPGHLETTAA